MDQLAEELPVLDSFMSPSYLRDLKQSQDGWLKPVYRHAFSPLGFSYEFDGDMEGWDWSLEFTMIYRSWAGTRANPSLSRLDPGDFGPRLSLGCTELVCQGLFRKLMTSTVVLREASKSELWSFVLATGRMVLLDRRPVIPRGLARMALIGVFVRFLTTCEWEYGAILPDAIERSIKYSQGGVPRSLNPFALWRAWNDIGEEFEDDAKTDEYRAFVRRLKLLERALSMLVSPAGQVHAMLTSSTL